MSDRAYTNHGSKLNIGVFPLAPVYRRSLASRLASSERQCRGPGKHKGRARRHRREVETRQHQDQFEGLRAGAVRVADRSGRSYSLGQLLRDPLTGHPGWARSLQHRARNLLTLGERHHPRTGWGIQQSPTTETGNSKWTPYYVPKAAERCWRAWRRICRDLDTVLRALARVLSSGPSTPSAATTEAQDGKDQGRQLLEVDMPLPVCRDHSREPWGPAAEQLRLRLTM